LPAYVPRYPGPIQVAGDPEGRHFAEGALDPRLKLAPFNQTSAPAPDLVIIRGWRAGKIASAVTDVPRAAFERVAAGQAMFVIDASGEGPEFDVTAASAIHKMLREVGVPTSRVAYVTQNRAWEKLYHGFCQAMRVEPVEVHYYDYYIRNVFREHEHDGEETFHARRAAFEARKAEREKRFVCLNFTPRPAKVLLLLKLLEGGQYDQGFISFPGFDKNINDRGMKRSVAMLDLLKIPELGDVGVDLMPFIDDLAGKGSSVLGPIDAATALAAENNPLYTGTDLDEYNRSWFTVVTESEAHGRVRITEKPFKPLANFTPYITLGNPRSLELARDFGFKTFGEMFDESYDIELDLRRRFHMVYDEIARLCALPEPALREMEAALADTLAFNAHRALIDMPVLYRDVMEPQLVDRLMDIRNRPI
jgi:hypothetical protein